MGERRGADWRRWWPFAALCVAASSEWMITDASPRAASTLASEAAGCGLAALLVFAVALGRQRKARWRWQAVAGGALVLGGPVVGLLLGASLVDAGSVALAMALTPVVVAVAWRDEAAAQNVWPGLVAVGGLLLLIPAPSFGGLRDIAALVLAPLLTGLGCVVFRRAVEDGDAMEEEWHVAAGLLGGAVAFALGVGVWAAAGHATGAPAAPAVGIDFALALLSMLALGRLEAALYTARYVVVPLIVLLQGLVFLRATPTLRSVGCAVLLGYAGWSLLRLREAGPPPVAG